MKLWKFKLILSMASFMLLIIILGSSSTITPAYTQDKPTPTPSTTPVAEIILPDWVHDPTANILILETYEEIDTNAVFTLINIDTAETFAINLPYIDGVRWLQAEDGLYLKLQRFHSSGADNSDGFNEFVNAQTNQVMRYPLGDVKAPTEQIPTQFSQDNGAGLSFELTTEPSIINLNATQFRAEITLKLILHNPAEDIHSTIRTFRRDTEAIDVQWVGGGQYLGVTNSYYEDGQLMTRVNTYDAQGNWDSASPRWAQGGLSTIAWSPGERPYFLYNSPGEDSKLCLAEAWERRENCDWFPNWELINKAEIKQYTWSADGSRIIIVYRNEDEVSGGLCLFELATGDVECPIQKEITEGYFGSSYLYTAPNQYGVFRFANYLSDPYQRPETRQSGICYLDQTTYETDCLAEDVIPPDSYYRALVPSSNGQTMILIYQNYVTNRYDEGLCIMDMNSLDVSCPVTPEDLTGLYISRYTWSPDNRYFVFLYNGAGPYGDDMTYTQYGVVDTQTGVYRYGSYAYWEYDFENLWRPELTE